MSPHARIAALLRELADAFDDLAQSQSKTRRERPNRDAASTEALRRVQDGLRRKGVRSGAAS